jgi:hypothetical protein
MATSEIAQYLTATLSPDPNTRISAELKLAEYFTQTGAFNCVISTFLSNDGADAGLSLSHLILSHEIDMSVRQMS